MAHEGRHCLFTIDFGCGGVVKEISEVLLEQTDSRSISTVELGNIYTQHHLVVSEVCDVMGEHTLKPVPLAAAAL